MAANLDARILLIVLAIGFLLAGCSSSDPQLSSSGRHRFKPGQPNYTVAPYQINGIWYHPKADYSYDETGTASWYGPGFDGKMTSDGEVYDMNQLTAAHKTLPLPSVVQVTNLQNGRALQLRVNGTTAQIAGSIVTNMTDFRISPPSVGFTTVQPAVTIEFQLILTQSV